MFLTSVKKCLGASLLLSSLLTSSSLFAVKLRCGDVSVRHLPSEQSDEDVFPFEVTQSCVVTHLKDVDFNKFRLAYAKAVPKEKEFTVNHGNIRSAQSFNGYPSVSLTGEFSKRTIHGKVTMDILMHFYVGSSGAFQTYYKTERVRATGNAKATKQITDTTSLRKTSSNEYLLNLTRKVKVERMGIASGFSDSAFIRQVFGHLKGDFKNFRKLHEDLMEEAEKKI